MTGAAEGVRIRFREGMTGGSYAVGVVLLFRAVARGATCLGTALDPRDWL